MSRRQEIRDQQRREMARNRILVIILVSLGSLLVVAAIVIPMIDIAHNPASAADSTTAITPITPKVFIAKVDGQHLGDPSAPVKIDVWEDFQCPACRNYSLTVEPQVIANYVDTGKAYYTYHFYPLVDGSNATGNPIAPRTPPCAHRTRVISGIIMISFSPTGMVRTRAHSRIPAWSRLQKISGWI